MSTEYLCVHFWPISTFSALILVPRGWSLKTASPGSIALWPLVRSNAGVAAAGGGTSRRLEGRKKKRSRSLFLALRRGAEVAVSCSSVEAYRSCQGFLYGSSLRNYFGGCLFWSRGNSAFCSCYYCVPLDSLLLSSLSSALIFVKRSVIKVSFTFPHFEKEVGYIYTFTERTILKIFQP